MTCAFMMLAATLVSAPRMTDVRSAAPIVDDRPDRVESPLAVGLPYVGAIRPRSTYEIDASNWSVDGCPVDRDYVDFDKYCEYLPSNGNNARLLHCRR